MALCTVCAWKGVNNLLNHTLPEAGTSGSTKQVWGLPEQDSIYGRLRRLMFPAVVSTTKLFSQHYHQDRATTLACFHKYLVTPPCQKGPVSTGTSKTGAHSWMLTNYACCKIEGDACKRKYNYDHACLQYFYSYVKPIKLSNMP